ncbi:amidohydrolase family protein [Halopiger xanaduensis]|uniref:S-adenosylhomocysteine deaminase n=1 Tax=Halopiger xanaduensis (strain DSM 18323 / JCM 14033 / SH-6) TaxID=797210 RepID=F8DAM7_HALXS|nr:amidohydrolase family protein [Halopiger xanaduensis]AEH35835.1 S-adenosylhomocysteine deaminase [Halopiger xanaduensis SH-6]
MPTDDRSTDDSGVSRRNYLGLGAGALAGLSFASVGSADGGEKSGKGNARGNSAGDRLLVTNGTIVTVDPDLGILESADLLVEDGRIERIDSNIDAPGAATIDAGDAIVAPGFVNAHLHTWQAGVRGIAGDWSFMEYLETMLGEISSHYEPEDAYLGNLFGALEQLNAGATTILDWFHIANSPEHTDRAIDGLEDAGVRAVFAHGPPGDDSATWWEESTETHPDDIRRLHRERFPANDGLLTLAMGIRGPDYSTDEVVARDIELARELGIPASMHIGSLGPGGVETLEELGLLGDDLNYVHANRLTEREFELIGDSGGSVSITPEVEMQMGMGMPALRQTLDAGAIPSLGVDIVSNVSGDMFTQTRFALQTQRALDNQPTVEAGEQVSDLSLTARQALEFATIEGARALGLEDQVGSLTPGKRADVVLFETDDLNTTPAHDPVETIVFQSGIENVDTVLVDGDLVKYDGDLINPAAERRRHRLVESGRRILEESGVATLADPAQRGGRGRGRGQGRD